jgi:2'-5' RNA ligase
MATLRLFVCTWLDAANQAFFGRQVADLVATSRGTLRAVPRDSAHITYSFLGHVDDGALLHIVEVVRAVTARQPPFAIELGPPSILYARTDARLVHAPIVTAGETVATLTAAIATALQQRLPDVEISGSHSPHVTLARFRKGTHRRSARRMEDAISRSDLASARRPDEVREVQVVSSALTAAGPRYITLDRAALGG